MKKLLFIVSLLYPALNATPDEIAIPHPLRINVEKLLSGLSLADKLTILTIGRLKELVSRPDIHEKLSLLETEMDASFKRFYGELASEKDFSRAEFLNMEIKFKQTMVVALYAALYNLLKNELAEHGSDEQKIRGCPR